VNILFICSNTPAEPAYELNISVYRYSRSCPPYQGLHYRILLLSRKLLSKGFIVVKLMSLLRNVMVVNVWCGWLLRNICVTDNHRYVTLSLCTEIFSSYAGSAGVLLHINRMFTIAKLKPSHLSYSIVLNQHHCQFICIDQGISRPTCILYPLFQVHCDRCDPK
jgi:hypothetical protein